MTDGTDATTSRRVGARLGAELERAGISQAELARRLEVAPSMVSRYVAGTTNMNVPTLVEITEILGCEPCTLLKDGVAA